MLVQSLGYVGIGASNLDEWSDFATNWLGMQPVDHGNAQRAFRMDDRKQRLVIDRSLSDGERFFGWEVADAAALQTLAAKLEAAGVRVRAEPRALADQRFVTGLISFADPAGNRLEAFHGPMLADAAFKPGRTISGFRTGPLGMGHAVFHVKNIDDLLGFYRDTLGFGVSDYITTPFRAYFMHVNPRHHSLALIETGRQDLHHLMVELYSMDDVGQGYDIALGDPDRIATTLGRHPNDAVMSYYLKTPSGFLMEYGWGGKEVTPGTWNATECTVGPSLWGHDRVWMSAEQRAQARDLRLTAAQNGERMPVQVMPGNFETLTGTCPWWDNVKAGNAD